MAPRVEIVASGIEIVVETGVEIPVETVRSRVEILVEIAVDAALAERCF